VPRPNTIAVDTPAGVPRASAALAHASVPPGHAASPTHRAGRGPLHETPSGPRPDRIRRWLMALVVLALLLRVGAIVALRAWQNPNAMEHKAIALFLLDRGQFLFSDWKYLGPSSVQSPPYPLLLAGLFKLFHPFGRPEPAPAAFAAAMVINALAGAATVWLTYLLARTLGGSAAVGLGAAAACAVWPTQVYSVTHAQAICLITAGVTAVMVLFYRSVRGGRLRPWLGYSLVGTLAALTEPVLLPVMALSGLLVLGWRRLPPAVRVRNAAVLLLAALIVIGPWTVRNRRVHGQWIPIKSTFWVNVWKGNNENASGTDRPIMSEERARALEQEMYTLDDSQLRDPEADAIRQYDLLPPDKQARLIGRSEAERERVFKEFATTWIKANPGKYARLCLVRLGKTLWIDWDNPKSHNVVYVTSHALLLGLSAAGLGLAIRRRWSLLFPLLMAGSCLLTYTLTVTAARFSIPFEPLQLCFASLCVVEAWRRFGPRPGRVRQ